MDIKIYPSRLRGSIEAIPSKSDAHRLLICAALADRETEVVCPAISEDIAATAACLAALGAQIAYTCGVFRVQPIKNAPEKAVLDCGESGSTLRFLLPVAAAIGGEFTFEGRGRLPQRPLGELLAALGAGGVRASAAHLPLTLSGRLAGGEYSLPGNVSSQYVTGLLLALPKCGGGSVKLTTPLESSGYVDMTVSSMKKFGINVISGENRYIVPENSTYISPKRLSAEGDWSNAAFFLIAGCEVTGLDPASVQGDRAIVSAMSEIRAAAEPVIDLRDTPDMLPALAVFAALGDKRVTFTGAARLRIKESDRLKTVCGLINALGGAAEETEDGIRVSGTGLKGGEVSASGDHRIAMAAAIAGSMAESETILHGAEAVNKSYPGFCEDYKMLGGRYDVI